MEYFYGLFYSFIITAILWVFQDERKPYVSFRSAFVMVSVVILVAFGGVTLIKDWHKEYEINERLKNATYIIQFNKYCNNDTNPFDPYCITDSTKQIETSFDSINYNLQKFIKTIDYPIFTKFLQVDSTLIFNRIKENRIVITKDVGWYGYHPRVFFKYRVCIKNNTAFSYNCEDDWFLR
jgi:hypothetical protein